MRLTFEYAGEYYTWIAVGAASIILGLVPSNILRTEGLAMQAMAGSILGSIVNIILDPVFIFDWDRELRERRWRPLSEM